MDRREYLKMVGVIGFGSTVAGCLGSDELYEDDADSYILSADEVSNIYPEEYEEGESRGPEPQPSGYASSEIITFEPVNEGNFVELGIIILDEIEDAEITVEDTFGGDETDDEDIGDEGYSASDAGISIAATRISNVIVQVLGADALQLHREALEEQIDIITD